MKKMSIVLGHLVFLLGLTFFLAQPCFPCSTFVLMGGKHVYFGRNWDHYTSKGLIIVNKKNVAKTALLAPPETPVQWVSKYGSITFNQIGKEFPYGGMNEKGLVVEMMWLEDTKYPEPDKRSAIMEVQWIQYQLDNFSTVKEVIQSNSKIRISQSWSKLHYLVCDRSGDAASIEFIDGKFVCHTGQDLPVRVLTNDTYDKCLDFMKAYREFEWKDKVAHTSLESKDRFVKIAKRLEEFETGNIKPAVEYAFDILSSVSAGKVRGACTAWSIIYDLNNLQINFKTFENRNIRIVKFSDFDFACSAPSKVLDITKDIKGDVYEHFFQYTKTINRILIQTVFNIYKKAGFIKDIPAYAVAFLANYPETLKCK